jgi:hypothetical protein
VDHRSFRDQLAFSIGFAVTRSRGLLRRLLTNTRRTMRANSSPREWSSTSSSQVSKSTKTRRLCGSVRRPGATARPPPLRPLWRAEQLELGPRTHDPARSSVSRRLAVGGVQLDQGFPQRRLPVFPVHAGHVGTAEREPKVAAVQPKSRTGQPKPPLSGVLTAFFFNVRSTGQKSDGRRRNSRRQSERLQRMWPLRERLPGGSHAYLCT